MNGFIEVLSGKVKRAHFKSFTLKPLSRKTLWKNRLSVLSEATSPGDKIISMEFGNTIFINEVVSQDLALQIGEIVPRADYVPVAIRL